MSSTAYVDTKKLAHFVVLVDDIEKATDIARAMVTQYGMSKKFGLMGLATIQNKYLDGNATLNCSDVTAAGVDEEVMKLLKESYEKALELLRDNRQLMDKLAEYLIEKETITGKEFMKIYRQEKGIPDPEEEKKEEVKPEVTESSKEEGSYTKEQEKDSSETEKEVILNEEETEFQEILQETVTERTKEEQEEKTEDDSDAKPRGNYSGAHLNS